MSRRPDALDLYLEAQRETEAAVAALLTVLLGLVRDAIDLVRAALGPQR